MSCLVCLEYYEEGGNICSTCDLRGICNRNGEQPTSPCCEVGLEPYIAKFSISVFPNGTFSARYKLGVGKGEIIGYRCSDCGKVIACRVDGERPTCPKCNKPVFYTFAKRNETLLDGTHIKQGEILGYRCTASDCNFSIIFTRKGQAPRCQIRGCSSLLVPRLSSHGFLLGAHCPIHRHEYEIQLQ